MADISPLALRLLRRAPLIGDWLDFSRDGEIIVRTGKAELGQGILTAVALIAAEELVVDPARVRVPAVSTRTGPDADYTSGSFSVSMSGAAIRAASAAARTLLLQHAAEKGAAAESPAVADGCVGPVSYWTIAAHLMSQNIESTSFDFAPPRADRLHLDRLDLPDKFAGRGRFVQDLEFPGLLFGRVVRSPRPGSALNKFDDGRAAAVAGVVKIVRDGDFIGVLAEREEAAIRAAAHLGADCAWTPAPAVPVEDESWLMQHASAPDVVMSREASDAASSATRSLAAAYSKPYLAHASIGPSCGVACFSSNGDLEVWSHTQGVFPLRRELALILAMPEERIVVNHVEGSGCYGHNGAEDAALDAVLMARAVPGRAVKVQWSRADEFAHEPYGPVMSMRLNASLNAEGKIVSWRHEVWSNGHLGRPGRGKIPTLLAAAEMEGGFELAGPFDPPLEMGGGSQRNAVPLYDFPDVKVTRHLVGYAPVRVSSLRSLGAYANVFALESFMDELAIQAAKDPVQFRLAHLSDVRARTVLEAAAECADWWGAERDGRSLGVGFAQYKNGAAYCAVIAEVDDLAPLGLGRLFIAADAGRIVTADGVLNQLEGGAIQAVSWTMKEAVRHQDGQPPLAWGDYPILRFSEVPQIETVLIDRPDMPSVGVGECVHGPAAAAIANAFAKAHGVRIRNLPITRERVLASIA